MSNAGASRRVLALRKIAATVAVLVAWAGFEAFAAQGGVDAQHDPVTTSVLAQP